MFSLSWLRERGQTRARPSPRRRVAKAVALGFLVATTMLQTGCRSGGFGNGCGLFSPCGFPARATSRIMQPFRRFGGVSGVSGCGDGCGQPGCDSPVVYDSPGMVVSPGVPLGSPTTIVPGTTVPSTVSPADAPTQLEALPSAAPDAAPSRNPGVRRPSSSSSYDSRRPVQNPGVDLTSAPVSRSSRTADADPGSVLDNLPPLDVPPEVAGRNDNVQAAPAAVKSRTSGAASAAPSPSPSPATTSASPHDPIGGRAEGADAARDSSIAAVAPAPVVDSSTNGAVGVARFVPVDINLAGGAAPTTVGLGWLAEKGYRTILDLRDPAKIDAAAFMAEAARRNLRYVSFPTDLTKLDADHVDRFSAELALDAARPLYFFDEDGRTAGALWYVRSALNDKVGWDVARRDAENMGLADAVSWNLVRDFVEARLGTKAVAPPEDPKTAPAPAPVAPAPKQAQAPAERQLAEAPAPAPVTSPLAVRSVGYSDAWQPFAAMLVTGLTFRMAFIGRSSIATIRARTRASLPAPAPRS